jgi:hypothetical protein
MGKLKDSERICHPFLATSNIILKNLWKLSGFLAPRFDRGTSKIGSNLLFWK